jgi:hypothetical protein
VSFQHPNLVRKASFSVLGLILKASRLTPMNSRPAGLLPLFGKVQLTSVGVFLSRHREVRVNEV